MHAFLIVGNNGSEVEKEIEKLQKKHMAKVMPYEIAKIEDVRNLTKFLRLSINEPTLISINNIQDASTEALNSFLKHLEEPQENIKFVLTAPNTRSVLPTITSRCEVIKISSIKTPIIKQEEIEDFLDLDLEGKIAQVDTIKDRGEAISFVENLIYYLHQQKELEHMDILIETLSRLKKNANVNLQLTNLVINF